MVLCLSCTVSAATINIPNVLEHPGDHRPVPTEFEKSKDYSDLHYFPMAADPDKTFAGLSGGTIILGNDALFYEGATVEGYVKPWVQDTDNEKALFAETNLGTDWTECYLPFTGIANIKDAGIRFGGKIQDISIKDFCIINYKNSTTIDKLPSTIK